MQEQPTIAVHLPIFLPKYQMMGLMIANIIPLEVGRNQTPSSHLPLPPRELICLLIANSDMENT